MSIIIKMLSKFDDSGIKQAKKKFGGLKTAIGAIGIGIGISQITDLLMDSAKAASADAKSTKILNTQLVRNAGATKAQIIQSDKFVETLSLQTGIFDDDLRPAYAKFANVTGNVKDAQKLLTVTIDAAAGSGKSQTKIANAVAKAYDGNTTALVGMFPELKKSKDVLGDFTEQYRGMAEINADPFMKFNNSMDILKEKLGAVILPLLISFVDEISKPGGLVDQVGKFLDDMSDPKTEAGKFFTGIKDAAANAYQGVKDFFGLFGDGNAVEGFKNVAKALMIALPALIALKAIMFLSQTGKSLVNLVAAIAALRGAGGGGTSVVGGGKGGKVPLLGKLIGIPVIGTAAAVLSMSGDTRQPTADEAARNAIIRTGINPDTGKPYKGALGAGVFANGSGFKATPTNNITINVLNADPKATVDALGKYVKTNGKLPTNLFPGTK